MGVSYCIRCKKCHEAVEALRSLDKWELAENLEASFWFDWGKLDKKKLASWILTHTEHGDFEFTAE